MPPVATVETDQFTAPVFAIGTDAMTIDREAQHRTTDPMFAHDRSDMGDVMLHRDDRQINVLRQPRTAIIRVEIGNDRLGPDVEKPRQMVDRLAIEAHRFDGTEIADMLRDEGLATARQRDGGLQVRAQCQNGGAIGAEVDRIGHEAARAPEHRRTSGDHLRHAVVSPDEDRPVMRDDEIGDAAQSTAGILIIDDERFAAGVGRRRDEDMRVRRVRVGSPRDLQRANDAPAHRRA